MARAYGNVSIGTSAAVVLAAARNRTGTIVQNLHATQDLYVGNDSSVSTSNGLKIPASQSVLIPGRAVIYGIASGASTDVRYLAV